MTDFTKGIEDGIRKHLDAVRAHLTGSPADRGEILRDLDAHIREALLERFPSGPAPADLAAVLAEMDPPEAYASPVPAGAPTSDRIRPLPNAKLCWWPVAGLILILLGPVSGLVGYSKLNEQCRTIAQEEQRFCEARKEYETTRQRLLDQGGDISMLTRPDERLHTERLESIKTTIRWLMIVAGVSVLFGAILGVVGVVKIRRSDGRLYGLPFAVGISLLLPIAIADGILWALPVGLNVYIGSGIFLALVLITLGLDYWMIRASWRAATRAPRAG